MERQNKQSSSAFISTVRKVDYKLDPHNNTEVKKKNFQRMELKMKWMEKQRKELRKCWAYFLRIFAQWLCFNILI